MQFGKGVVSLGYMCLRVYVNYKEVRDAKRRKEVITCKCSSLVVSLYKGATLPMISVSFPTIAFRSSLSCRKSPGLKTSRSVAIYGSPR